MKKTTIKKQTSSLRAQEGYFTVNTTINAEPTALRVKSSEFLLDALRRIGYKGSKRGCDSGDCGACTVLIDGKAALSCITLAIQAHGREITTIEGIGSPANPHPIQTAYVEAGAVQCGYCIPGMILATKELLDTTPDPDEKQIRHGLDGNLCRCTGYVKQIEAVKIAAKKLK